jgi:hypothetical protein
MSQAITMAPETLPAPIPAALNNCSVVALGFCRIISVFLPLTTQVHVTLPNLTASIFNKSLIVSFEL